MIAASELKNLARARLRDSIILSRNKRYDGAVYLCGYAVETAIKARICQTLKWSGFPETRREFEAYQSFKTHNLDVLLHLSGIEAKIKTRYLAEWSVVARWDPEIRYKNIGSATQTNAENMIDAVRILLRAL